MSARSPAPLRPSAAPRRGLPGVQSWRSALAALAVLAALGGCIDPELVEDPQPYTVLPDYLGYRPHPDAPYEPLFLEGVNLAVSVPGTQPGELAATREQYDAWLERMAEMGANSVRIYTLHYPRFYEAFADYNLRNPDRPLHLLHGIWLDEENPEEDLTTLTELFDEGIREVIDCAHGNCTIEERRGRAFGSYTVDISPWIAGWLIGREISQWEVWQTDLDHPEMGDFAGSVFAVEGATPSEAWAVERMDYTVAYERDNYDVERPVSMSSWPTLDPLRHPDGGDEDIAEMDFALIEEVDAPAGWFASYHAYPYYPDFIPGRRDYQQFSDRYGTNAYLGYLEAMRAHFGAIPFVVAEVGIPSSWGNAHYGTGGMDHGGHDEALQAFYTERLIDNIWETGCGGVLLFAWIDEWWKRTWITDEIDLPRDRFRLWWNVTAAEQNFGLIAWELDPPTRYALDGFTPTGAVESVTVAADAAFFHLELGLTRPLAAGEQLTLGFDTHEDERGEVILPDGTRAGRGYELALALTVDEEAQLLVTEAYDLFGIWHGYLEPHQQLHSIPSEGRPWHPVRWLNNDPWEIDPADLSIDPVGQLQQRRSDETPSTMDAVVIHPDRVEIRLPWTLLQFTDPSTRSVMADDRDTFGRETLVSEGIGLALVHQDTLRETVRFAWQGWDEVPGYREREKPVMETTTRAFSRVGFE